MNAVFKRVSRCLRCYVAMLHRASCLFVCDVCFGVSGSLYFYYLLFLVGIDLWCGMCDV